jgi:hypothetical protein
LLSGTCTRISREDVGGAAGGSMTRSVRASAADQGSAGSASSSPCHCGGEPAQQNPGAGTVERWPRVFRGLHLDSRSPSDFCSARGVICG